MIRKVGRVYAKFLEADVKQLYILKRKSHIKDNGTKGLQGSE